MTGISGTLIQMARIALNWEQARLAKEAGCHKNTVGRIERGTEGHFEKTRADIVRALESAGIVFIAGDATGGAGVRWATQAIESDILRDKLNREQAKEERAKAK